MDLADVTLIAVAGLAAGTANSIAGGGTLMSFPALIAAGLSPITANVTNSLAIFPGYAATVIGGRDDVRDVSAILGRRRFLSLIPTTAVGTVVGCVLLLVTPPRAFDLIIPFLVLIAGATVVFGERLRQVIVRSADFSPTARMATIHGIAGIGSIYGGYFGAALGIMLIAFLSLVFHETLARISALKNAISVICAFVTAIIFVFFASVDWVAAVILLPATTLGGYCGARLVTRLPARILRPIIATYATTIGLILLWRALGNS